MTTMSESHHLDHVDLEEVIESLDGATVPSDAHSQAVAHIDGHADGHIDGHADG